MKTNDIAVSTSEMLSIREMQKARVKEMLYNEYIELTQQEYHINAFNPFVTEIALFGGSYYVKSKEYQYCITQYEIEYNEDEEKEIIVTKGSTIYLLTYYSLTGKFKIEMISKETKLKVFNF
jgi:hypothetical protein